MYRQTKNIHEVEVGDDTLALELPITLEQWEDPEIEQLETDSYIILGYLAHDQDCSNPLEDCDAMGVIHHHPRSRYGGRGSDYYEALGLDSYGDPVIDEAKLQALWAEKIKAIPVELFVLPEGYEDESLGMLQYPSSRSEPRLYPQVFKEALADESAGDYALWDQCKYAWCHRFDLSIEAMEGIVERIDPHLTWDWEEVSAACKQRGNPDAVLLDRYEHGMCSYSVHSNGGCPWDTSRGEAVWVPDKHLSEELAKITDPDARWKEAVEYAEQACSLYTDWANGNCYGYVIGVYDKVDGELVEEDSCWGFVGDEHVEETLKDTMGYFVKKYAVRLPDKEQLEMEV